MENEFYADAQKTAQEAYDKLSTDTFESTILRYTQNDSFLGCEKFMMEGMLISTTLQSTVDWSDKVKNEFSKLQPGQYSSVFRDDDGFHIIYYVGDEPAGAKPFADVAEGIRGLLLSQARTEEWNALVTEWMKSDEVQRFEDVYRSVGTDSVG